MSRQGRELAIGLFLFMVTFAVFWISPILNVADSQYSMLLSESILTHHTVFLDGYSFPSDVAITTRDAPPMTPALALGYSYQLGIVHGHVLYLYPHGSSLLSLPFVAIANLFGIHTVDAHDSYSRRGAGIIQKTLAAFLMAVLTVLIYRTALFLLGARESLILTLGCAFGTQIWSSASRAMWSSTWLILLAQIAILELLHSEVSKRPPRPLLLATILSWMYFCRPTASIPIAVLTVYMFWFHRRGFITYAVTGAFWCAAFVAYSRIAFGEWIPGYYTESHFAIHNFPVALAGLLISPSRGLFIIVPATVFVLYRVARYWRWMPERPLAAAALAIVALLILSTAVWPIWWGGWSYGPRILTDTVPWFVLLAILGLAAAPPHLPHKLSRIEAVLGFALVAIGIATNAPGALSYKAARWNVVSDVNSHPERAFDWSYPQFLAEFISAPERWRDPGS